MDNVTNNDSFGVEDVQKIYEAGANLVKSIKTKKKAKEAQALADAGEYWFLSPTAKKLIQVPSYVVQQVTGKGITQDAILNFPKQPKGTPFEQILPALQLASGYNPVPTAPMTDQSVDQAAQTVMTTKASTKGTVENKLKKALPYVIGAAVIGVIIYLISKK
jgi:hypothetical protein